MPGAADSGDALGGDSATVEDVPEDAVQSDGSLDDEEHEEDLIFGPSDDDGPEDDTSGKMCSGFCARWE